MSAFGGKADIHRPGDDGARAAVPDETLLDLRCYVMPHRINQITARTPISTSVNTPAMIFTCVAALETRIEGVDDYSGMA